MKAKEIQEQIDKLRIVHLPDPEDADYLDAVLRQAADTMQAMLKENELLEKVVEAAKCPNNCMAGAVIIDGGSTAATMKVCQWCADRKAALKGQT